MTDHKLFRLFCGEKANSPARLKYDTAASSLLDWTLTVDLQPLSLKYRLYFVALKCF